MKRLIISSLAASLLLVSVAQAQQQSSPSQERQQRRVEQPVKKNQWKRGGKLPSSRHHAEFKDYRKHGLQAPGKGQRWVRVDGQYLLIAVATGAILSVAAGR